MNDGFQQIAILGGGLLGGSLALALQAAPNPPAVRLWARRAETVGHARDLGIGGATHDLAEAVHNADLAVLAVPVGSMPELAARALDAGLPAACLVTDVGSVKRAPHQTVAPLLAGRGVAFIGSHPMAGSERGGIAAVAAGLFEDAACLLTNDEAVDPARAAALERFWQRVGCRIAWMSAAVHDELVARISHMPHLVAASAARICLREPAEGRFGGGGLRDTTRVAAGDTAMWTEIVSENRAAITGPLREMIADLMLIAAALDRDDTVAIRRWLDIAKQRRDQLLPPS